MNTTELIQQLIDTAKQEGNLPLASLMLTVQTAHRIDDIDNLSEHVSMYITNIFSH